MVDHTTRAFDADLHELANKIVEMGRLDGEQITNAIDAWARRDAALAHRVIATDDQVDDLQQQIEEKVITTIARRQPMAVDLAPLGHQQPAQHPRAGERELQMQPVKTAHDR